MYSDLGFGGIFGGHLQNSFYLVDDATWQLAQRRKNHGMRRLPKELLPWAALGLFRFRMGCPQSCSECSRCLGGLAAGLLRKRDEYS